MEGEGYTSYVASRVAAAGLAQRLPFRNASFDRVTSTWAFPTCLYDCGGSNGAHVDGYSEILRVLKPGGMARLGPLRSLRQIEHTDTILRELENGVGFSFTFPSVNSTAKAIELVRV